MYVGSFEVVETLCASKRYPSALEMETAKLNGNKIGEFETSAALHNAESAVELMCSTCKAVKERRWNEAEEMLKRIQSMVHQLRVDVRDERLGVAIPEGLDDSRRDGSR
jgi:hypothetical protein